MKEEIFKFRKKRKKNRKTENGKKKREGFSFRVLQKIRKSSRVFGGMEVCC